MNNGQASDSVERIKVIILRYHRQSPGSCDGRDPKIIDPDSATGLCQVYSKPRPHTGCVIVNRECDYVGNRVQCCQSLCPNVRRSGGKNAEAELRHRDYGSRHFIRNQRRIKPATTLLCDEN